ncbi:lipid IV(A) 3-deoxy-D-manno-octulosonic acid transferase [Vibrio sp. CK2-1]|uniref:lipid IV(A) 3-deoxy-D-manno-octulosonic acid transferase n=1 Tax=Vibrio sp. CK2-1 TaxID=2912249 RepID=UPI001F007639|nr:lipid IV(A) 3-deoxy-D-manno-octulosonic acid transferase [Vibrio sp. CK2-1]MCF7355394.1 lipid IV(A) 3-deoxy-D-manno-octulosonic acid transferase [Vibrio sp. CK2-1]
MLYFYTLFSILLSPIILFHLLRKKEGKPKVGKRWKEYLGFAPKTTFTENPIWIHAVSVGEVIACTPVIISLRNKLPQTPIIITTTTSTGAVQVQDIINNKLNNDKLIQHRYMPLDIPFSLKIFIKKINPKELLIVETELWPNVLKVTSKNNIPVTLLNARLSEKSYLNYNRFNFIKKNIFPYIDKLCVQNSEDADRFISLGVKKEKVTITGSIKYDFDISLEQIKKGKNLKRNLGIKRPIWIAISTHEGEEKLLLDSHKKLLIDNNNILLIIAPRHPERFNTVKKLINSYSMKSITRTEHLKDHLVDLGDYSVYLADTMGEIFTLIEASDVCFVAGSLLGKKVGGHNVLEPAALSKPILMGPSYYNFKSITNTLINGKGLIICNNAEEIANQINNIISNKNISNEMGQKNLEQYQKNKGAVTSTIEKILN